ncbi:MAG: Plasmid stabilization system [Candidatus Magasanikbacteria bacterium]|nr:Plasmid stabilization system [Candidatus Magasanikbacteria bacterium]
MDIYYRPKFRRHYKRLPPDIRDLFKKKEGVFRQDPFDYSLRTHKLHGKFEGLLAFWIDYQHRVIFEIFSEGHVCWFHDIGAHDVYD